VSNRILQKRHVRVPCKQRPSIHRTARGQQLPPGGAWNSEVVAKSECKDFGDLRRVFDNIYSGGGVPYAFSYASEVVTKAVRVFRTVRGDTMDAIIAGVNMGRDTDCVTAIAAGISGALTGGKSTPDALIKQVGRATSLNPYTNSQRTLRETSDGLDEAYTARLRRMKAYVEKEGGKWCEGTNSF
jgi:hypothetical protein